MRLFVGIALDERVREACAACARDLRTRLGSEARALSYPKPESLHLTLKFLGAVADERAEAISEALSNVGTRHAAFDVTLGGTGAFPPRGTPNVLWIGLTAGAPPMAALANDIDAAMETEGFPRETRPFSSHLTIARVKDRKAGQAARAAIDAHAHDTFGTLAVREFVLFRSDTRPDGAVYTPVTIVPLSG